jgi:Antirestriction protein (ArdA)
MTVDPGSVWVGDLSVYADRLKGRWAKIGDRADLHRAYDEATHGGTTDFYIGDMEGPSWVRMLTNVWGEYIPEDVLVIIAELANLIQDETGFSAWVACSDEPLRDAISEDAEKPHHWGERPWRTRVAEAIYSKYEEELIGTYSSRSECAESMARMDFDEALRTELAPALEQILSYVDFAAVARDCETSGSVRFCQFSDGVYAFTGNL